MNKKIEK